MENPIPNKRKFMELELEFWIGFFRKFLDLGSDFPGNLWIFPEIPGFGIGFSRKFMDFGFGGDLRGEIPGIWGILGI